MVEKIGTDGNDFLERTDGDDTLRGVSGNDTLLGYLGNQILDPGTGGQNSVDGGAGGDGDDRLTGSTGEDTLLGTGTLNGGADNDQITLYGSSTTTDFDDGGDGNDNLSYIRGGKQDILRGGAGNDMPNAGYRDTVTLDRGEDVLRSSSSVRSCNGDETMIPDDDGTDNKCEFLVSRPILVEGDCGTTEAKFEVSRSRPALECFTVDDTTVDGSADAGEDDLAIASKLTFGTGQTTASVSAAVDGNTDIEPTELLTLDFTAPAVVAATSISSVKVLNEDADEPMVPVPGLRPAIPEVRQSVCGMPSHVDRHIVPF